MNHHHAPEAPVPRWATKAQSALDWAYKAHERFLKPLSEEVRARLGHSRARDVAYIVVFGKTQVGKTTLLLDLIGVQAEVLARVSKVVRGGRTDGQSSTSTVLEYRRSPDSRWGLRPPGGETAWHDTDDGMIDGLGGLRQRMEAGALTAEHPGLVFIPADCLTDMPQDHADMRVLDMPGDNPRNATERAHVAAMAGHYIRHADLILLVGRADDLTFLQPGGVLLPDIDDWQFMPRRFRIVLTRAFEPDSLRTWINAQTSPVDVAALRTHYLEQLSTVIALKPAAFDPERFFLIDVGDSWSALAGDHQALFQQVAPIVATMKDSLKKQIHAAAMPLARLHGAVEAHEVVSQLAVEREAPILRQSDDARSKLRRLCVDHKIVLNEAKKLQVYAEKNELILAAATVQALTQNVASAPSLMLSPNVNVLGRTVVAFQLALIDFEISLWRAFEIASPRNSAGLVNCEFWKQVKVDMSNHEKQVKEFCTYRFQNLRKKLKDYWTDSYLSSADDSSYGKDSRELCAAVAAVHTDASSLLRETWLRAALAHRAQVVSDVREHHEKARSRCLLAQDIAKKIATLKQDLLRQKELLAQLCQRKQRDLEDSLRFKQLLDEAYLEELQRRREAILRSPHPAHAFVELLAALHMSQTRHQSLPRLDFAESQA